MFVMKWLFFICGVFLFIGVANLPIGYYTFLRIIITVVALVIIIVEHKNGLSFWNIVFALIAILFNPLFPVYINDKETWNIIDIICGALFMIRASKYEKTISI